MRSVLLTLALLDLALGTPLQPRALPSTPPCDVTGGIAEACTRINAVFKQPLAACYWWKLNNAGITPDSSLSGWDMNYGCNCLVSDPKRAKSTLNTKTSGTGAVAIVQAAFAQPKQFCTYWLSSYTQTSTPLPDLSIDQIQNACKTILGNSKTTTNIITNPNFQGSGAFDSLNNPVDNNLNLAGWDVSGAHVEVLPPYQGYSTGNLAVLRSFSKPDRRNSSIGFHSQYWAPANKYYRLSWTDQRSCSGSDCSYDISFRGRSIWNSTANPADSKFTARGPVSFVYVVDASVSELAFTVGCGKTGKCNSNEWSLADVLLTGPYDKA